MNFQFEYDIKCPRCGSKMTPEQYGFSCECGIHMYVTFKRIGIAPLVDADYDFETEKFTPRHVGEPVKWLDGTWDMDICYEDVSNKDIDEDNL